jgi:hypothetical protein
LVWRTIAIGMVAFAALSEPAPAAEPAAKGGYLGASERGDQSSVEADSADLSAVKASSIEMVPTSPSAVPPEEPPATEPVVPQGPATEAVPLGEAAPVEPGQNPDGLPLPPVDQVLADQQMGTPVVSSNCWFAPNHWYSTSDFMVINHDKPLRNTRFTADFNVDAGIVRSFISEQNFGLGITEGGRFSVGVWRFHDTYGWDHAIEASFFGLTDWHKNIALVGVTPGSIFTFLNTGIGGFNAGDLALFYYKSQFNSGGLDLRWTKRQCKDALVYDSCGGFWKRAAEDGYIFTFLLGVHDGELDERFTYNVRRANMPPDVFGGNYTVRTTNNLLGLHIGSELDYRHDLWYVGVRGGSTICVNFAEVDADLDFHDPMQGTGSQRQNGFLTTPGAMSDFSLIAGWQVRPNMRIRASYDLFWLTSVATAPSQIRIGAFQPQAINAARDQMYTGCSLGLEFNW